MLVGEVLIAVVAVAAVVIGFTRRRSHDDVHSVEGYHRQLHTLEHISVHPVHNDFAENGAADGVTAVSAERGEKPSYPESAVRIAGSSTVRVTDPRPVVVVPPVPPPLPVDPKVPVPFDDATPAAEPESSGSRRRRDRAMSAMNRRPRRLAAPAAAVAGVTVLIVVLLVTGSHKVPPAHHPPAHHPPTVTAQRSGGHASTSGTNGRDKAKTHHRTTTTTTTPAVVSLPTATSLRSATYQLGEASYTLVLGTTTGPCWVDAVSTATGSTLYSGVLEPGEQHSVTATGTVTVQLGAPSVFSGTVNGTAIVLPYGFQTPFTLQLDPRAGLSS